MWVEGSSVDTDVCVVMLVSQDIADSKLRDSHGLQPC
uniref:Uncharacterized protein n=1 Tax=Octopus bimaculoides TaxID=37653 RepID=A0A0L8FWH0_OCTBM